MVVTVVELLAGVGDTNELFEQLVGVPPDDAEDVDQVAVDIGESIMGECAPHFSTGFQDLRRKSALEKCST